MLTSLKDPLSLVTIRRVRLSIIIIFVMSTMGMISFNVSSRTYGTQLMQPFKTSKSVARTETGQVKIMVAELPNPVDTDKVHTQPNNTKLGLSELKSFGETLYDGKMSPKRENVSPTLNDTAASNSESGSIEVPTTSSAVVPDSLSNAFGAVKSGHFVSKFQLPMIGRESYQPNAGGGNLSQEFPAVRKRVSTYQRPYSPRRTPVLQPIDFSGTKEYYGADWSKTTKANTFMRINRLKPADHVPFHELANNDPYRSRLLKIQESCEQHPDPFSSFIDIGRMTRDDKHRAIMCVIPKAACTTWKSALFYLLGGSTLEGAYNVNPNRLVLAVGQVKTLARLRGEDIVDRLNNFTKFTVTRHPFHRLVSAYRDKFQDGNTAYAFTRGRTIAQRVLASYLKGQTVSYGRKRGRVDISNQIKSLEVFKTLSHDDQVKVLDIAQRGSIGNITFEEFLRFGIVNKAYDSRSFDIHWRPQYVLCNPCAINYDFVVRFEDLVNESNMVLNYLQRNESVETRIYFPSRKPATVTDNVTQKFFSKISPELREAVRKVYQKDFEYFNYDPDIF